MSQSISSNPSSNSELRPFRRLVDRYRREMLEEAAREHVDTIFTFVYGKGDDDEFVRDIVRRVESHNGKVLFVRLCCGREELPEELRSSLERSRANSRASGISMVSSRSSIFCRRFPLLRV